MQMLCLCRKSKNKVEADNQEGIIHKINTIKEIIEKIEIMVPDRKLKKLEDQKNKLLQELDVPNSISDISSSNTGSSYKSKCELYFEDQLPSKLLFNEKYKVNSTWNDGTNITTLKDYRVQTGSGFMTELKSGNYRFYQGDKPGQNINQYYIEKWISHSDLGSSERKDVKDFYLEYDKSRGITEDGTPAARPRHICSRACRWRTRAPAR